MCPGILRWEGEGRNGKALERWARRDTIHSMGLWQARWQHAVITRGQLIGKIQVIF